MLRSSFAKIPATFVSFHGYLTRPESGRGYLRIFSHDGNFCAVVKVEYPNSERSRSDGQAARRRRPKQLFLSFSRGCRLLTLTRSDSDLIVLLAEV